MSDERCGLLTLPSEVFAHIGPFLSPHSVCQLELTSRVARQAVEMANVWRIQVKQLATETSSVFVCSSLAFLKDNECRDSEVFKIVLRVSVQIDTMVEEIKTWLTHIWEQEETVGAVVKKWEVEVIPIMSDHGHETDQVLAKIFLEGIKDVERKVSDLEFSFWFMGISFSVLQEENIVAVYLTKPSDDVESRSTEESDHEVWSGWDIAEETD
eukprot:GFUD01000313.1.p1 GENE.GFUD01000313.1~~GFUD01000313.1.p1  ORF type:complete len:222 (+),score=56.16 GFUD01000313.1:32-667(+)